MGELLAEARGPAQEISANRLAEMVDQYV